MTNHRAHNILFIIPNLDFGGAQRSICRVSKAFSKNHNVYVCAFNLDSGVAFGYGGQLLNLGVPGGNHLFSKALNFLARCMRLRSLKKLYRVDISISYLEGANYVNLLSRYRDKVIISVRGSKTFDMNIAGLLGKVRLRILLPLLYRLADWIVALSHGIRAELMERFMLDPHRIRVIYNFYDLGEIETLARSSIPKEYEFIFDGTTVISAGRLSAEKGFDYLLSIFAQLKKLRPQTKLVVLGEGESRGSLVEYSRSLGLNTYSIFDPSFGEVTSGDVFFLGYQDNPFRFFSRSTLFVLTSRAEGGPNALSEAMSCGLPVMSADCPTGPRERITFSSKRPSDRIASAEFADFGILMPTFDREADGELILKWAETLDRVLADTELLCDYSKKARLRMEDFTKARIFPRWEQLIFE